MHGTSQRPKLAVERRRYREGAGRLVHGIVIVTAEDEAGSRVQMRHRQFRVLGPARRNGVLEKTDDLFPDRMLEPDSGLLVQKPWP